MDLLGQTLFGVPFNEARYQSDMPLWNDIYAEAARQTVLPTTVGSVPVSADEEVRYRWIDACWNAERKKEKVLRAHPVITAILKKNGIPFVILKGIASGSYYPEQYQRNYGDIDILIKPEQLNVVREVLRTAGYEGGHELPYEYGMEKDGVSFDIHTAISELPDGQCGKVLQHLMEDIMETAIYQDILGERIPVPDDFHHGVILIVHTTRHLMGFGVGLRQLCDWAVFVNYMGERFPSLFRERLKEAGLWKFAVTLTGVCVKYLHMPAYTWTMDAETDLVDRLAEDFLRKGNLRHDGNDDMDAVFLSYTDVNVSPFLQMIDHVRKSVYWQWPFIKKHKVLTPFGMIWIGCRYLIGRITGTYRNTNLADNVRKADSRRKLYQEMGIYHQEHL